LPAARCSRASISRRRRRTPRASGWSWRGSRRSSRRRAWRTRACAISAGRELSEAQAELDRAVAAQKAADGAAGRAIIRAPFDGIVATRLHNPGDLVQAAATDPVLRVVDPRRLEVTASVPRADSPRVLPGATARAPSPADGQPVRLTVAPQGVSSPAGDGGVTVRLLFVDAAAIPVDSRVDLEIDAEERADVVFVPPEAVVRAGGETVVMVANGSAAERRAVTTGIAEENRVEIRTGLRAGELVITRGQLGLVNGQAISVSVDRR
jgi:membrane fusion protein, multidrug efflux system